jgi:hypothetical protein
MKNYSTKISLQIFFLLSVFVLRAQVPGSTWVTIHTPKGVPVSAQVNPHNQAMAQQWDDMYSALIIERGWQVVAMGVATTTYQCHGYAWSKYNNGIECEINGDVKKYFTNDAYVEITEAELNANWQEGVIIVYGPDWNMPAHSAVTTNEVGKVISKWWYGKLYKHTVTGNPWGDVIKRYFKVQINGADKICTYNGSSSYTAATSITNASYSWSVFNNAVGGNSNPVTITNTYAPNTTGWIKVSIYSPWSNTTIKGWKKLCVGENNGYVSGGSYSIWGSSNNSTLCPYTDYTLTVNAPCSASNYTATFPNSNYTINYITGNTIYFNTGAGGSGNLVLRANVWCSQSSGCCPPAQGSNVIIGYGYVDTNYPYCNSWFMSVSPNPAGEFVEIEVGDEKSKAREKSAVAGDARASEDLNETYQLTVYNSQQVPVYTAKTKIKKTAINTRQFPNGIYVVELLGNKERVTKRFAVNH